MKFHTKILRQKQRFTANPQIQQLALSKFFKIKKFKINKLGYWSHTRVERNMKEQEIIQI